MAKKFHQVAIAQDGFPVPMVAPDPRLFALHKLWLAEQPDCEPVKKGRDRAQGKGGAEASPGAPTPIPARSARAQGSAGRRAHAKAENPAPFLMQISVPIQRGASGGPVLDQAGNVIGVVVSKLDALKLAERLGDLPQNVNFAIRGEFVRNFLEANRIEYSASSDSVTLESTEIASRGAAVTVTVRCMREAAKP